MLRFFNTYFPTVTKGDGSPSLRLTLHHSLYYILLFVLVGAQPVSNFMMSGMEILLAVNWVVEWDMRRKFSVRHYCHFPLLMAYVVLLAVHLLWMLNTTNIAYGWNDIFRKLPLIAIPLVLATSRPLNRKQLEWLFFTLVATVFVATVIGRIRMVQYPDIPYREVPFISHIRFALNICLSLLLILWFLARRHRGHSLSQILGDPLMWVLLVVGVFMLDFLLRIKSYTALGILAVVAVGLLLGYWRRFSNRLLRIVLAMVLFAMFTTVCVLTLHFHHDYYAPSAMMNQSLAAVTCNGNPYIHRQDGLIENGNYVNNYICTIELEREWAKCSSMNLGDTTPNGYTIQPTLIRYLNALGVAKDSAGMQMLMLDDVRNIEQGIANPVYASSHPLRQMYYVMFFEYESYRCFNAVKGFTMLQRIELWRNAWIVFTKHPIFGVGTGDVVDVCHLQLLKDRSPLAGTNIHSHNQYLTFLVTFGIVGFLILAVVFVWALRKERLQQHPAAAGYLIILFTSFLTEDTLETLAGAVFSVLFLCLLACYRKAEDEDGLCCV